MRGFANWSPEKLREVCRKGAQAAAASGRAHRFTSEEARKAGKIGGIAASKIPGHMAKIGRLGGMVRWGKSALNE